MIDTYNKVFGIGLSRTGTTSLTEALNVLDIPSVHFPYDATTLEELRLGHYQLSILDRYRGITDIGVAPFYAQLDHVYPNSKFILTIRNKVAWLNSCEISWPRMFVLSERDREFQRFADFIVPATYGVGQYHRGRFDFVFETHQANVISYFSNRPQDLLIMDISTGQGWDMLCPFLGKDIPDAPFPVANTTPEVSQWLEDVQSEEELVRRAAADVAALVPTGASFILIDHDTWGSFREVVPGRRNIPFPEKDGQYWGLPGSDAEAIAELERLRRTGASFAVVASQAFWWLDFYCDFSDHLFKTYPLIMRNDRVLIFRLD